MDLNLWTVWWNQICIFHVLGEWLNPCLQPDDSKWVSTLHSLQCTYIFTRDLHWIKRNIVGQLIQMVLWIFKYLMKSWAVLKIYYFPGLQRSKKDPALQVKALIPENKREKNSARSGLRISAKFDVQLAQIWLSVHARTSPAWVARECRCWTGLVPPPSPGVSRILAAKTILRFASW